MPFLKESLIKLFKTNFYYRKIRNGKKDYWESTRLWGGTPEEVQVKNSQKFRFGFPEKWATLEGSGDAIPQVHTQSMQWDLYEWPSRLKMRQNLERIKGQSSPYKTVARTKLVFVFSSLLDCFTDCPLGEHPVLHCTLSVLLSRSCPQCWISFHRRMKVPNRKIRRKLPTGEKTPLYSFGVICYLLL